MADTAPEDLTALTDDELDARWMAVMGERQRRADLAAVPDKILETARKYLAEGGDPAKLPTLPPPSA